MCFIHRIYHSSAAKSHQSCPVLCDPTDGSPPGSPIPGILQARTLESVAISFSNAWKVKRENEVAQSCSTLHDPMDGSPPGSSVHGICQARVLEWAAIAFSAWAVREALILSSCCSVAQSCPTLCDPMDCTTPGFPVLHRHPNGILLYTWKLSREYILKKKPPKRNGKLCDVMEAVSWTHSDNHLAIYTCPVHISLYTLNLLNVLCQLFLNIAGKIIIMYAC